LRCVAQDLRGQLPRRIHYTPTTGKVIRRLLGTSESSAVAREERDYVSRLSQRSMGGEIQLFD
jgi:chemotaxis protein CheD